MSEVIYEAFLNVSGSAFYGFRWDSVYVLQVPL
jgi:hypothetical protein